MPDYSPVIFTAFLLVWPFDPFHCNVTPPLPPPPSPHFLSPVTGHFFLLRNLTAYFCSSSFYLFFGFPTGILSPRLASRIPFVILLLIILNTCPVHFNLLTSINVNRMSEEWIGVAWTGLIWLRIGTGGGLL
jgi:hypothetical protein